MLDCKSLATLMVPNLKLTCDENFDLVDAMYRHLIKSLMDLVSTEPNICHVVIP